MDNDPATTDADKYVYGDYEEHRLFYALTDITQRESMIELGLRWLTAAVNLLPTFC